MRRVLVLLLSLVALVAAGCGGGDGGGGGNGDRPSQGDYGRQLSQATTALQRAFSELQQSTSTAGDVKAAGQRLSRGASALEEAADRFDGITPPKASEGAHRKLVSGLRELASVFQEGADAAKRGNEKALQQTLQGLAESPGVRHITEAQQELQREGVKITTTTK